MGSITYFSNLVPPTESRLFYHKIWSQTLYFGLLSRDRAMLSTQAAVVANRLGSVIDGKLVRTKISTPLGSMIAVADDAAVFLLEFENRVALTGELRRLERNFGLIGSGTNTVLKCSSLSSTIISPVSLQISKSLRPSMAQRSKKPSGRP